MSIFDNIIKDIPQEERAILEKYPQLKNTIEDLERKTAAWNAWAEENWDREANATKAEVALKAQLEAEIERANQLEQQIGAGDEMTFDQILAGLKNQGFVTKAEIDSAIAPHVKSAKEEALTALNRTAVGQQFIYAKVTPLAIRHPQEFGEDLDIEAFFKHMEKTNSFGNPQAAYDSFVAEKRESKRRKEQEELMKKHQEELEAARREAEELGRKKALEERGMSVLPGDQRGQSEGLGPLQKKILDAAKQEDGSYKIPEGTRLGDDTISQIGAQMYLEGKLKPEAVQ